MGNFNILCSRLCRPAFLAIWVLARSTSVGAGETNAIINAWLDAQTNLHTWHADFVQIRQLKSLKEPLVTTGQVWFARPDRFRWELGAPAQTIALRNADVMYVIYPLLKRAERYSLGAKSADQWRDVMLLMQSGFPESRSELDRQFSVNSLVQTNGAWELGLQPASSAARRLLGEIVVGLDRSDYSLLSTELIFADNSRMRSDFTNAVINPRIEPGWFDWTPPEDFKITEPLKP